MDKGLIFSAMGIAILESIKKASQMEEASITGRMGHSILENSNRG